MLNSFSFRCYDKTLLVTSAFKAEDVVLGNIKEVWKTSPGLNFFTNVETIIKHQFRNSFPNMAESMVSWEHTFIPDLISMKCVMVRPGEHKQTYLIKKCLHTILNGRFGQATKRFHAVFYDLYRDFKIPPQTIPFVVIEIQAKDESFDIKLLGDQRKFYFKPQYEKMMYEKMRFFLWTYFNKLSMD